MASKKASRGWFLSIRRYARKTLEWFYKIRGMGADGYWKSNFTLCMKYRCTYMIHSAMTRYIQYHQSNYLSLSFPPSNSKPYVHVCMYVWVGCKQGKSHLPKIKSSAYNPTPPYFQTQGNGILNPKEWKACVSQTVSPSANKLFVSHNTEGIE